ncbi:PHD-finger motif containing protein [Ophiocordyceps sinensis CO18]|uniref:PHD-finger motif containing protein n=1 Tax=Ophiocordyceps sinensis (strain Co18 / CGMCC 3.14243) TaxID=911162 RepID=T5A6G6_OPHSC|nr:PHD-finger motif containing protein [Ophiocordyceps sinensis CO18]
MTVEENDNESTDNGMGGRAWECVAVTLQEVQELLWSLGKTRDENEKTLRRQLATHLIPILEKQGESRKRKQLQKERELLNLAKMANAKRSSRIAGKVERQKQEDKVKEEEERLRAAQVSKHREERGLLKMEQERDFRTSSRQRRLQEREARRLQHEEELAQLSEDSRATPVTAGRMSERRRQAEIDRNRQALKELSQEGEAWVFDCTCGLFGQVDDGTHSVACEKCNVWQHSKCLGISEEDADRQEFQFVCEPCRRRNEAASMPPKETLKMSLDTITCSTVGPQVSEQPDAGQSTTPVKTSDGTSKKRDEKPGVESVASLSADKPLLYSASERENNAQLSPVTHPHSTAHRFRDSSTSASLSRQHDGDYSNNDCRRGWRA